MTKYSPLHLTRSHRDRPISIDLFDRNMLLSLPCLARVSSTLDWIFVLATFIITRPLEDHGPLWTCTE